MTGILLSGDLRFLCIVAPIQSPELGPVSRPSRIVLLVSMASRQEMQIDILHCIPSSTIAVEKQRGQGIGKKWSCGEGKDFKASSAAAAQHRSHP